MNPFTVAMVGLNVAGAFGLFGGTKVDYSGYNRNKKKYEEIYKEQLRLTDLQMDFLKEDKEYIKYQTSENYKKVDEAYAENYVRLNNAYASQRLNTRKSTNAILSEIKGKVKMNNIVGSSISVDLINKAKEDTKANLRQMTAYQNQEQGELSKQKTQQYINLNESYFNAFKQNQQAILSVGNSRVDIAGSYASNISSINGAMANASNQANSNFMNYLINAGMGMSDLYGDWDGSKSIWDNLKGGK
ncbi:MAG: hypothetical protein ACRC7S_11040 [Cetobacterium sp.]